MEEKDRLVNTIKDTNNNKKFLKRWIAEEKALMVYNNDIAYAEEKGRKEEKIELIRNMLEEGLEYSIISKVSEKLIKEIKEVEQSLTS